MSRVKTERPQSFLLVIGNPSQASMKILFEKQFYVFFLKPINMYSNVWEIKSLNTLVVQTRVAWYQLKSLVDTGSPLLNKRAWKSQRIGDILLIRAYVIFDSREIFNLVINTLMKTPIIYTLITVCSDT